MPFRDAQPFSERLGDDYSVLVSVSVERHNHRQGVQAEIGEKPSGLPVSAEHWETPHSFALVTSRHYGGFCSCYSCLCLLHVLAAHHEARAVRVVRVRYQPHSRREHSPSCADCAFTYRGISSKRELKACSLGLWSLEGA